MTTGPLRVDFDDLQRMLADLDRFAHHSLPFAARNALNAGAFGARREWADRQLPKAFILRNKFTVRSLRVVKARGGSRGALNRMAAELGSVADYMGLQESGGTVRGKSGSKPIPSVVAAGQAMGSRPRTRVVRRPMRQPNIRLKRVVRSGSRSQRNAASVREAASSGRKFALLDLQRGKAIARVTGRKRLTVRVVWDLSRKSVRVPPHPTLQRTLAAVNPGMPSLYANSIIQQLRRNRVLGY